MPFALTYVAGIRASHIVSLSSFSSHIGCGDEGNQSAHRIGTGINRNHNGPSRRLVWVEPRELTSQKGIPHET